MQPSHAVPQTAASGQSLRWHFTLLPVSFIFVVSVPVLALSQRGSRNSSWGSAHGFRSGANVYTSKQGRLYDELQRDSGEANSMIQRSTQQLGALQESRAPAAAHSSNFMRSPQQTWPGVVSSVAVPSAPTLGRTPTTAEANSYSFRGSAAGSHLSSSAPVNYARPSSRTSGTMGIALVAPQQEASVPYGAAASINSFTGNLDFPRNSAPTLALDGTPHRTIASSYSVSVPRSAIDSQRLYGAYTDQTPDTREAASRSGSGLALRPSVLPVGDNVGTQSTFSSRTFSSGNRSEINAVSPFSSTIQTSPATSTFTPWNPATQQRSEVLVNGLGDIFPERSSTTLQSNYVGAVNPERQRTVSSAQSTLSSPNQRLRMIDSSGGARSSERDRLPDSLPHARGVPSPNPTNVVYTGFEPRQIGSNERASVITSNSTVTTELRSFVAPSSEFVAASGGSRLYAGQPGLEDATGNTTVFTSVERDTLSSPARVYVETPRNDEETNTASAGKDNVSLYDANATGRFSLQHQNVTRPLEGPPRNTIRQASGNDDSKLSELRDGGSPAPFERNSPQNSPARDTSHNHSPASPCQLSQDDALLDTDNSSNTCVGFDGSHRLETTTVPTSVPSLREDVSPAAEQLSTNFPSASIPAEDTVKERIPNDKAKALNSDYASLATEITVNEPRAGTIAAEERKVAGNNGNPENPECSHTRVGYIPPEALTPSPVGARGRDTSNREQLLYGDLRDYTVDEKDPFAKALFAVESQGDGEGNLSVTTTSTATTQTYPPFYNPYSDSLDVDDIPDSPYHNYKWAVDPFPSTYSTHSRLENYESEFNNRYYHEERTAPNITWEEYTRRRSEVDDARKREAELQNEGKVGLIESSDSLFQGLIGYPNRGRMSRSPL